MNGCPRPGRCIAAARRRLPTRFVHLDTGASGRSSAATLNAVAEHAAREAVAGAYVAEAEAAAVLEAGRADIATLLGMPAAGVVFTESASAALAAALAVWPLDPGDAVAVAPSEWGPNLAAFGHRQLTTVSLPTRGDGVVDTGRLERALAHVRPALVHLTLVASHRPLVQPAREVAAICHAAGVPLWVDAAQALGHTDAVCDADVIYATSRKWLAGPRGVGVLAVAERWWDRLPVIGSPYARGRERDGCPPVRLLESTEAHVAGRVGLSVAVGQHQDAGPAEVRARLAEVGTLTRNILTGLPGWTVLPPAGAPSAITALRPVAGQDVPSIRDRLLAEHGILTTACLPARAPREMTVPLLRISPDTDCTSEDLTCLHRALSCMT